MPNKIIPSWVPHGLALKAYWEGNNKSEIGILMDDGETTLMPASIYFRSIEECPELERVAFDYCKGRVLDIGAGAGAHTLILKDLEYEVIALDIDSLSCEIMNQRGVSNVICSDFLDYKSDLKYDTLLFLMNGIGIAGSLSGLKKYLSHAKSLINTGGQILLDSSDLRISNPDLEFKQSYFGEVNYKLSYEDILGDKYSWLYIDFKTLSKIAKQLNWNSELIFENEDGSYLARLFMKAI